MCVWVCVCVCVCVICIHFIQLPGDPNIEVFNPTLNKMMEILPSLSKVDCSIF